MHSKDETVIRTGKFGVYRLSAGDASIKESLNELHPTVGLSVAKKHIETKNNSGTVQLRLHNATILVDKRFAAKVQICVGLKVLQRL